ncbi:MAG: adenylate/guanylate cyclase domain-containing protein [Myxococcota bacterium]
MRGSRTVDWLLLGTLLPVWLAIQGVGVHNYLAHGPRWFPFSITGAQGAAGHPVVDRLNAPDCPLRVGDRVVQAGGIDLQGLSRAKTYRALTPLLTAGRPFRVEAGRGGERFDVMAEPAPQPYWWSRILGFASLALAGTILLLRAPHWPLSRRFFVALLLVGSYPAADLGQMPWVLIASAPLGMALALSCAFEWTEGARPLHAWQRLIPWLLGFVLIGSVAVYFLLTIPAGLWPYRITRLSMGVFAVLILGAFCRAYWRSKSLERRQLRWVLYGFCVALLPVSIQNFATALGTQMNFIAWQAIVSAFLVAIPLGIVVSVVGYHWLDIDRLISASAAATLVGIALLGGVLAVVPPLARAASAALGVDPEAGRLALSMALAAVLVPAYRALRPWLDQRMFAERHALAQRFERLRSELANCRGVEELATRAGEGIDAMLCPDAIATYALSGDAFTPLFVRGRAAPPAFEVKNTLVQVLEAGGAPLFARAKELGPFERAALETLGAEVVVPVLREKQLLAFTCLAGKRSGDIYTASDLALLATLAERCSEVIARLDADEVARQAQAMQSALRRYVPGAVAERVLAGDALEPAEREVSVLFVDIREYTQLAAGLRAAEVFATLNEHTERVSRIVQECGGTIVEFNGDGLMAVFGAHEALPKKEQAAVEAARRIVDSMPEGLAVGVGVATGEAFVGSIRSTDRLIWSAVGSTTNLASRLQSMTRELDAAIAIDETTRERAGYVCTDFVRHADLAIRGRTGRFDLFVLPLRAPVALSA